MVQTLLAIERGVGGVVAFSARALLTCAALVAIWQVVSRFVLHAPSDWSEVLTRALLIWCVYLGTAMAFRRGALVSVELLRECLDGRALLWLERSITVITVCFLALIAILGAQLAWLARFQTLVGFDIAISWAYLAIPVGCAFAILSVFAHHLDPARRQLETAL
jgi:TRAP-type C4-dicarboxylate transport system permease small subunit